MEIGFFPIAFLQDMQRSGLHTTGEIMTREKSRPFRSI